MKVVESESKSFKVEGIDSLELLIIRSGLLAMKHVAPPHLVFFIDWMLEYRFPRQYGGEQ